MGILNHVANFFWEKRVSIDDPHYWPTLFGKLFGTESKTGIMVNTDSALRTATVFACIRVLAETEASLPLQVFKRRKDGGKDLADGHSLYPILHDSPNHFQTSFEHREMYVGHLGLTGNAYDYIVRNGASQILELMPMDPSQMEVELSEDKKTLYYAYKDPKGESHIYSADKIWHKKGMSYDGYVGLSPIQLMREPIGLALALESYGATYFGNFAKPAGFLSVPGKLTDDAKKKLKESWANAYSGPENTWKTAILEHGLDWKQMSISNQDSQFLDAKNYQVEEICRIFGVPSILVQHPDKTSTYKSSEQFMLSFVMHTIRPRLVKREQSMNLYLLSEKDRKEGYFCEHNIEGLLRGDIKTRYTAYEIGRRNKWLNANEIRAKENMNPIEGDEGEIYENPNTSVNKGDQNNALPEEEE